MNATEFPPMPADPRSVNAGSRPPYVTPRIQEMSEKEILNTFQITQSMGSWWVTPTC